MQNRNNRELKLLMEQIYAQKFDDKAYLKNLVESVKTIPTFFYDEKNYEIKIELKEDEITNQHADLSKFYNELQNRSNTEDKEFIMYIQGDELVFKKVLAKYIDILHFMNRPNTRYYTKKYFKEKILVELQALEDILNYAIQNSLNVTIQGQTIELLANNMELEYDLELKEEQYYLTLQEPIHQFHYLLQTNHYLYIHYQNKIYRCDQTFIKNQYAILNTFLNHYFQSLYIAPKNLTNFFSLVYPNIKNEIKITTELQEKLKPFIPQILVPKLYLDFDHRNYLIADLKFCYDTIEFNPIEEPKIDVNRNLLEEAIYLNKLIQSGFLLDEKNKRFIMNHDDAIYEFIEEDLQSYMQLSQIYTTENFDKKKAKKTNKTILGIKVNNHLLEIDFKTLPINAKEMKDVLEKYRLHKKYYRLKDGSFITLENNQDVEFLNNLVEGMDISYKNMEEKITLPVNRSLYLDRLLRKNEQIEIETNQNYKKMIQETKKSENKNLPIEPMLATELRDYQKIGYQWLMMLDQYEFGGILADDMGLR